MKDKTKNGMRAARAPYVWGRDVWLCFRVETANVQHFETEPKEHKTHFVSE